MGLHTAISRAACLLAFCHLGGAEDCNLNGVPDDQDIQSGASTDCDSNGVPDECDASILIDFDGTMGAPLTFTGLWHTTGECAPDGDCGSGDFAYFGVERTGLPPPFDTCSYETGSAVAGFLTLSVPLAQDPAAAKMWFCYALVVEGDCGHDFAEVVVDGQTVSSLCQDDGLHPDWTTKEIDLSAWAGQTVVIRFHFWTDDANFNCHYGWAIDDIRIGVDIDVEDCDGDGTWDACQIAGDPDLDLDGDGVLDSCQCPVTSYCTALPNSTGLPAAIGMFGSPSVSQNQFVLRAGSSPPGQFGLFFYGEAEQQTPFGNGVLCVNPGLLGLFRLGPPQPIDTHGTVLRPVDFTAPPAGSGLGQIHPGSTWRFQFWFRDPTAGGSAFNLSNGLSVGFCP